jgi:Family of unknown function (DUF6300)
VSPEIEVDVAGGRCCHRCDKPLMLVARTSHPLTLADGSRVEGTRSVGLCAGCDRDTPDAQGLLAFFAVHETVTDETVSSVAALLAEWVDRVAHHPTLREQATGDEVDT